MIKTSFGIFGYYCTYNNTGNIILLCVTYFFSWQRVKHSFHYHQLKGINTMKRLCNPVGFVIIGVLMLGASGKLWAQAATSNAAVAGISPWNVGIGGGYIKYEGDEATRGGGFGLLRIGYDHTPRWTFRGELSYFPNLKANTVNNYETGAPVPRPGLHGDSTWAAGLAGDALFHFNAAAERHWDPYLLGGIGLLHYEKTREWRSQTDVPVRAGIGLAYHFNAEWAVNLDVMGQMTIDHTEFNLMPNAGVMWRPAGREPARSAGFAIGPAGDQSTRPAQDLKPAKDDLRTFQLAINSTEGQWYEYYSELDAIAKIIQANPDAEILIEGRMEQQANLSERDARQLTEKRAEAVRDYLVKTHNIARKRFTTTGYGFATLKAANDPAGATAATQGIVIRIRAPQTAR